MSDNLDTLSDAKLNECFAVDVAGKVLFDDQPKRGLYWEENGGSTVFYVRDQGFSTDANAVLPWLEKYEYVDISREHERPKSWTVCISVTRESYPLFYAQAPTFARAACIALLRAKRATA